MKKEKRFSPCERVRYGVRKRKSPQVFESGFVRNSKHKENTIYLQIPPDFIFELTDDEAIAIAFLCSFAVWRRNTPTRKKPKWIYKKML